MISDAFKAGFAATDITPPVGIEMGGYGQREQPSIGVLDPLYARALILDDRLSRVCLLSCDLLGFAPEYDSRLRAEIASRGLIDANNLMVACTHNHAGPATQFLRLCGEVDAAWMETLQSLLIRTVENAAKKLRPVTMHRAHGRANFNYDRRSVYRAAEDESRGRNRGRERNTRVSLIQFRCGEKAFANIFHYACHPVTKFKENRSLSAEYCGKAVDHVTRSTGAPTLFLNGACGNVNPLLVDSAGRPRESGLGAERIAEDTIFYGEALGRAAVRASRRLKPVASAPLKSILMRVEVPLQIPSPASIEQTAKVQTARLLAEDLSGTERWVAELELDWAREAQLMVETGLFAKTGSVTLQKISVGDLTLLGVSGEVFAALGKKLGQAVGDSCLVVGFANGNIGYLPTRKAFVEGGYEVEDAGKLYGLFGVGPETEGVLLREARRLAVAPE